jgi:hypothetical protein
MRLKIKKDKTAIEIELTTDTSKKPMAIVLTPGQLETAIKLLQTALNADTLKFELDI